MCRYRETERLEQDRLKRIRDKEDKLADWIRKKEEDIKGEAMCSYKTSHNCVAATLQILSEGTPTSTN